MVKFRVFPNGGGDPIYAADNAVVNVNVSHSRAQNPYVTFDTVVYFESYIAQPESVSVSCIHLLSKGIDTLKELMGNFFNPNVTKSTLPSMIAVIADGTDIKTGTIKSVSMTWSGNMSDSVTMNFLITIHDSSQLPANVKLTAGKIPDVKIAQGLPVLQTVSLSLQKQVEPSSNNNAKTSNSPIVLSNLKVTSITLIANSITTVYPTTKYNYVQRFRIEPIELSISGNITLEDYGEDYKQIADSFNTTDGLVVVKSGDINMNVRPLNFSVNFSQPILSVSLSGFYVS